MMLQITVIPMEKITQVLETIKQTMSKHPKFLWEKKNGKTPAITMGKTTKVLGTIKKICQNTQNSYGKNKNGIREY